MDELYALTIGGDDYITKPYNVLILLARIKLLLKRIREKLCALGTGDLIQTKRGMGYKI